MKHNLKIVFILLFIFVLTQLVGLLITKPYLPRESLPFNVERPQFEESTSYIPIFFIIIFTTIIALFLIKFRAFRLWKIWFFLAVFYTLTIAFSAFILEWIAVVLALVFAFFKIVKPNIIVHNLSEIFIYGGLAAIFVPVLSLLSIFILLIVISIYDMIAVWKTKHMIKMAKFQTEAKIFPGLLVPYKINFKKPKNAVKVPVKTAILGGGDMGFPLLFAGVVMKTSSIYNSLIVVAFTTIALFLLFMFADKKKFYPAMPFLSAGCFLGYAMTLLL